jgi:ABC-type Fe3+-hydroxamate transport system substrate-binding protein
LNLARIARLSPDLIIANKEENSREQIEKLAHHFPVWVSDIGDLEGAYAMMLSIGEMTGKYDKARALVTDIQSEFRSLPVPAQRPGVLYLIWQKPFMTAGSDTFIHTMLNAAGFRNVFSEAVRYPIITLEEIREKRPELILLSSEPFPFREKHSRELQQELPASRIVLVNGEMFSWYGSRLLQAPRYFQSLQNNPGWHSGN